ATFDGHRKRPPTDRDFDHLLHIRDLDAVARDAIAIDLNLEIRLADDAVGKDRGRLYGGHILQVAFKLEAEPFDGFERRAEDLNAHRRAESGLEHDDARFDRLEFRRARHT